MTYFTVIKVVNTGKQMLLELQGIVRWFGSWKSENKQDQMTSATIWLF